MYKMGFWKAAPRPEARAQDAGTRNPAKRYLRYKVSVVKMYRLRDTLLLLLHWKERELGHNSVWLCSHFSQFSSGIWIKNWHLVPLFSVNDNAEISNAYLWAKYLQFSSTRTTWHQVEAVRLPDEQRWFWSRGVTFSVCLGEIGGGIAGQIWFTPLDSCRHLVSGGTLSVAKLTSPFFILTLFFSEDLKRVSSMRSVLLRTKKVVHFSA